MQSDQIDPQVHHRLPEIYLSHSRTDDDHEEGALLSLQALLQQAKYPHSHSDNLILANFLSGLYLLIESKTRRA
jgi:hypothetical protein